MNAFRASLVAVSLLAVGFVVFARTHSSGQGVARPLPGPPPPLAPAPEAVALAHLGIETAAARELAGRIALGHHAKPRALAGEWLAGTPEDGQTFAEYLASDPPRPSAARNTLYVAVIGDVAPSQAELIDVASEALGIFYGFDVKRLAPLSSDLVDADSRRLNPYTNREQFLTSTVLELLVARRPEDAVAVIGLTATDLWPGEGWNFVFGEASASERVGVWSLSRLGDPRRDHAKVVRRTVQVAIHETGHMLGIPHCARWQCGMNGSNSLEESDRNPIAFCPEDEMKVWWACRVDPLARYRALAAFAERQGLVEDARAWSMDAEAVARVSP